MQHVKQISVPARRVHFEANIFFDVLSRGESSRNSSNPQTLPGRGTGQGLFDQKGALLSYGGGFVSFASVLHPYARDATWQHFHPL